jgi:predicted TIM-barrel fold metal-dependent hydrolase
MTITAFKRPTFGIIDTVVNLWTPEALSYRPGWQADFYIDKMKGQAGDMAGLSLPQMLARLDEAGIERAFLVATRAGPKGAPSCYHLPYQLVHQAIQAHPDRFHGLAGIDPTEGMRGVRELERAVRELGFIGAHSYPHWFEIAPDAARYYPFYAKCIELDIPLMHQVGQSMIYAKDRPTRSVGRPITLDAVACDMPELKLIGMHVGIPWTDEMIAMAWKHPNVHIICDAHSPKYWPDSFVRYIDSYGQDKVIFGSDFPVLQFKRTVHEINGLGLREGPYRKLLRDNAIKLFKLNI